MGWQANLSLNYRRTAHGCALQFSHDGPLRVLKSLYPEGPGVCHSVLVHPPGGLVEGDVLDIQLRVQPGAHALVSTPGATRFYKSAGTPAVQQVQLTLESDARLEWLPLETLAYPGCMARNHMTLSLAPGAELLAWDITALGLPATRQPFDRGSLHQRLSWPGHWLEQAHIQADDQRLLESPLGLAGHRCLGTLFLACGTEMGVQRRDALLEAVRTALQGHPLAMTTGVTCPNGHVLVVRTLAPLVEPVMDLFKQLWAQLRSQAWNLTPHPPRIWSV